MASAGENHPLHGLWVLYAPTKNTVRRWHTCPLLIVAVFIWAPHTYLCLSPELDPAGGSFSAFIWDCPEITTFQRSQNHDNEMKCAAGRPSCNNLPFPVWAPCTPPHFSSREWNQSQTMNSRRGGLGESVQLCGCLLGPPCIWQQVWVLLHAVGPWPMQRLIWGCSPLCYMLV